MFSGYLKFAGREIINSARTETYLRSFLPNLTVVKAVSGNLRGILGVQPYQSPALDEAPWYQPGNPATGRFYGLYPTGRPKGADDSTRGIEVTDLSGDGVVHSRPRYGGREMRFTVMALAADDEALAEGLAWLRDALDPAGCVGTDMGCGGWEAEMLTTPTVGPGGPSPFRTYYKTELLEGPRITKEFASKRCSAVLLEFILSAAVPWAFTPETRVASVDMNTGVVSHADPTTEKCGTADDPYSRFINDPYFTAIQAPPAAPVIKPPNILDISSWSRRTVSIPAAVTARWGRAVPIVQIVVGDNDLQQMRLRFYRRTTDLQGCDYEGEFLVSYLPVGAVMTLNAITKEALVRLPGQAEEVPGGHLLYGSDGLPSSWPTLSCRDAYTMTIDMMPGNTNINVVLDVAVRE